MLTDQAAILDGKKYSAIGIFGKNAINDYVDLSLKQVLRQQCEKPFFKNMNGAMNLISPQSRDHNGLTRSKTRALPYKQDRVSFYLRQ